MILFIGLVAALLAWGGNAQSVANTQQSVTLLPRWKQGESLTFQTTYSRYKAQAGRTPQSFTVRTSFQLDVLAATNDAFVLQSTTLDATVDDTQQPENRMLQRVINVGKGLKVIFDVDAQGDLIGVRDSKEISAAQARSIEVLLAELRKAGADPLLIESIRGIATEMNRKDSDITEIFTLLLPLGQRLTLNQPFDFDIKLPVATGVRPIPSRARLLLLNVDQVSGRASLGYKLAIHPDEARRYFVETLQWVMSFAGRTIPQAALPKSVTIEDGGEFLVDTATGWPQTAAYQRTLKIDGSSQIDTFTLKRTR